MRFIQTFELYPFLDSVVSLLAAFVLGALIGAERQYRQRTAGLRTTVLVAVGAAAFVDLAMRIAGADGAIRVIAYVVSGIGFLGAGVIMKEGMNVRGLNTAATLCYAGHLLMEHRSALIVDAELTVADGYAERVTALEMLDRLPASARRRWRCGPRPAGW